MWREKQMKKYVLVLAMLLLAVVPSAMAIVDPYCETPYATVNAGSGQYVKISAEPCNYGIYYYTWKASAAIGQLTYITPDPKIPTSSCAVSFFAPTVTGENCVDYYVTVDVANRDRGSCTATRCIMVHVCPTPCPTTDKLFCDTDYELSQNGAPVTFTYTGQYDSSMTIQWLVKGPDALKWDKTADAQADGDGSANPKVKDIVVLYDWLNHPTSSTGTGQKACTDVQFILKDSTGKILVDYCTHQICLVWDPKKDATIAGTTSS
jgi:hypothetical protein